MRTSRNRFARTTAALATAGLTAGLVLAGPAAQAATVPAKTATAWLSSQLSSGLVESEYYDDYNQQWASYTDFGLSLDFFYAFEQVEVRAGQRDRILAAIEPRADEYTDAWGTTYAGAMGKLLTAVQNNGIDPSTYASGDLLPRLEGLVQDSGDEQGRAKDVTDYKDSSNTFGQSYVVTALTNANSVEADEAIEFLLQQQCAPGFFRQDMNSPDFTCDGGDSAQSSPSVDATATAAIALRDVIGQLSGTLKDEVRVALRSATRWLATQQVRSGTFVGGRNSNSTGLAAVALAAAGRDAAATKAAKWVNKLRVTKRVARRTALTLTDVGAVAYDRAGLKVAKQSGLARGDRYVWRRATAQAAPALDLL